MLVRDIKVNQERIKDKKGEEIYIKIQIKILA